MLRMIAVVLLSGMVAQASASDGYRVWTDMATRKLLREAPPWPPVPVDLDALRNEHEAFQVVITASRDLTGVRVAVGDLRGPGGAVIPREALTLRLAHYIELTQATSAPSWYPDALLPMPADFPVAAGHNQAVWVDCLTPADATPGRYMGTVTVTVEGHDTVLPVRLRVREAALTVESHSRSAFAVWGRFIADQYGVTTDSPEYKAAYERLYWFMTDYRMPPDDLPVDLESPEAARFLDDPRVNSFRIPYNPAEPEVFKRRMAHVRRHGWLDKGYLYTIDEPPPDTFGKCYDYGKAIDGLAPDARWLLTAGINPALKGAVDIWCPILSGYDRGEAHRRQAMGEQVWWYTCCGPQMPYPTYLINDAAISPRILSWMQAGWGVDGVLYWSVSVWGKYDGSKYIKRDVWTDPLAFPGANGDGYLIYPGATIADSPVPTLRLEMIRQGNEDFETFWLLKQRLRQAAERFGVGPEQYDPQATVASLTARVAPTFTRWEKDPLALEQVRREVLDEIEALKTTPVLLTTSVPTGRVRPGETVRGRLWAPPGADFTGELVSDGHRSPLRLRPTPGASSACKARHFTFRVREGAMQLRLTVRTGGHTRILTRDFAPPQRLPAIAGTPLCDWSGAEDLQQWSLSNVAADVTRSDELGPCAKLTYQAGVDFPNIRLLPPQGFEDTDWSQRGYLVFSLYNPEQEQVDLTLKMFGPGGTRQDGLTASLPPREATRYAVPISALTVDMTDCQGFELWMWRQARPRTIWLGPVVFTPTPPPGG